MPTIPLGGHFYQAPASNIASMECVNLYAFYPEKQTTSTVTLLSPAGVKSATTAGSSANRGIDVFLDKPYFVQGPDLYRIDRTIDSSGNATYSAVKVNGLVSITGSGRVFMANNGSDGDQMVIIDPESNSQFNAWIYDGSTLTQVSDSDFDGPVSTVRYVDGYFSFTKKDSQKHFISELRDGTSYLSTDFSNAEASPDPLVGQEILNNEVILFGSETMQTLQNVGGSGYPFASVQGSIYRIGLSTATAISEVNDNLIFLGGQRESTPSIWITNGGRPQKLSTEPIDNEISKYSDSDVGDCFSWSYTQAGAQFVAFNFPSKKCFVYDFSSGEWHTRQSLDNAGGLTANRISGVVLAYGELMIGDRIDEKIGILDVETYDEYGEEALPRHFVTPALDNGGMPFFINSLELVCEVGVGLATGQGSDPLVSMSYSKDGGKTYSNKLERSIGKIGEYTSRVIWNCLGRTGRQICFRFDISDPVKFSVEKIEANLD
jgi:hypothetical protein